MTEQLHFHFSLSCIGEGNGNPLQCSCLENPRDGGAWWAAVYMLAQSQTRLKRVSMHACMNTGVHVYFQIRVFIFSGYMPRDGIAGSYCSSIFTFFFFFKETCFP